MKYKISIILIIFIFFSCNEDEWLKEEPFDFYAPENSYTSPEQFNSAVARLYSECNDYIMWNPKLNFVQHWTSDIAYYLIALRDDEINSFVDDLRPEHTYVRQIWQNYYRLIFDANVIIQRIEDVKFTSETERNILKAEAMFFRAFSYKNLGIQYGGVPIILEEIAEPKRDFVRASRDEVWAQSISDLEFAAANLPHVTDLKEDGRLTKAAANHLLTELYIITEDYDKAIATASSVIDDPNYALMTGRFGTRKDEPGDVYWDLFRRGNQNRMGAGSNTESIWVAQYEYLVEGGGDGSQLCRFLIPEYWKLSDTDGVNCFIGHTSQNGGRGIGMMGPTDYFLKDIWESDPNDMRNSEHNIIRDLIVDNPASSYYGQKMVESGAIANWPHFLGRQWTAIIAKAAPIDNFPAETIDNPETGETNSSARSTFRDHYYIRLAETYLLRAEAYLGKGDKTNAAADINVVRARAQANPVAVGEVDIDYILDERARELNFEELRILTLMRLGKLAERVKKYDPKHNGKYASFGIEEYHNLWPIPQSEIESNTENNLGQNPGYN